MKGSWQAGLLADEGRIDGHEDLLLGVDVLLLFCLHNVHLLHAFEREGDRGICRRTNLTDD